MKLGLMAYATQTGLGYQTQAFYKHLKPYKTMVVDISELNGEQQYRGMYKDAHFVKGIPTDDTIRKFLDGLDIMLFAETPLNYQFYKIAREMGVKTANQINPEFFDHFIYDTPLPDMFILPSIWKRKEIKDYANEKGVEVVHLHFPVDRELFPYRQRTTKKPFHIAGKPASQDRNGTWDYMQANPNGTVITQSEVLAQDIRKRYRHSKVYSSIANPSQMYQFGDVMVLPRKYGGNCLPLNEALSSGCPVIMTDTEPNNYLLPKEWLVPTIKSGSFQARMRIDLQRANPHALQMKIQEIAQWDIAKESEKANKIAQEISWENMKPKYISTLEGLLS